MDAHRSELSVVANIQAIPELVDFVVKCLRGLGLDDLIFSVETSVDEACTNIIEYAYAESTGRITIACELSGEDFVVTIMDRGKAFDPTAVAPPDLNGDVEQRKIGGLGIHLMNRLMDGLKYSRTPDGENILVMRKRVSNQNRNAPT